MSSQVEFYNGIVNFLFPLCRDRLIYQIVFPSLKRLYIYSVVRTYALKFLNMHGSIMVEKN